MMFTAFLLLLFHVETNPNDASFFSLSIRFSYLQLIPQPPSLLGQQALSRVFQDFLLAHLQLLSLMFSTQVGIGRN